MSEQTLNELVLKKELMRDMAQTNGQYIAELQLGRCITTKWGVFALVFMGTMISGVSWSGALATPIGVTMRGAPVEQVFMHLQQASGLQFELAPEITGAMDFVVQGLTTEQVLDQICQEHGWIWYLVDDQTVRVELQPPALDETMFFQLLDTIWDQLVIPGGHPGTVFGALARQVGIPFEADQRILLSDILIPAATYELITLRLICNRLATLYEWEWFPLRQYEGIYFRQMTDASQELSPTATKEKLPQIPEPLQEPDMPLSEIAPPTSPPTITPLPTATPRRVIVVDYHEDIQHTPTSPSVPTATPSAPAPARQIKEPPVPVPPISAWSDTPQEDE